MRAVRETDLSALSAELASRPGVLLAYLFGSAARGAEGPNDLDVAVLLDLPPGVRASADELTGLCADIEGRLGLAPVDLRSLGECPLYFQDLVTRTGRCVFERAPGLRAAYEGALLSEFLEFRPVLEAYNRAMIAQELRGYHGR